MEGDDLYAYLSLLHKEKVTGHHHQNAFNPIMVHDSSLRENIVDGEDENMSPTQSETNGEPRREKLMVHGRELGKIVSSPTLKCPFPEVCSINPR
ncbi:hypothetical protein O181_002124 [Austropuccinia psidii MF-1]|uniref:Uncharacterized protein n=1 Tax=Austropuccinia psidii MF-1 TaxID=1389203 RepID=A0A9Q3BBU2_9BASI|nr:hypothetical protein [Austropuccinia psidii MF-1]